MWCRRLCDSNLYSVKLQIARIKNTSQRDVDSTSFEHRALCNRLLYKSHISDSKPPYHASPLHQCSGLLQRVDYSPNHFFLKFMAGFICKNRRSTSTSVKFNRSSFRSHIIGQCLHHVCGSRPESAERATAVHRPRDINTRADDRCTQVRESAWLADRPSGA